MRCASRNNLKNAFPRDHGSKSCKVIFVQQYQRGRKRSLLYSLPRGMQCEVAQTRLSWIPISYHPDQNRDV